MKTDAQKALMSAREIAEQIKDPKMRVAALMKVANAQIRTYYYGNAKETLEVALEMAKQPDAKAGSATADKLLAEIAIGLARAHYPAEATDIIESITDDEVKMDTFIAMAEAMTMAEPGEYPPYPIKPG